MCFFTRICNIRLDNQFPDNVRKKDIFDNIRNYFPNLVIYFVNITGLVKKNKSEHFERCLYMKQVVIVTK